MEWLADDGQSWPPPKPQTHSALQLSDDVRKAMDEMKKNFPEGVDYSVVYDPTVFVRHSIEAVVHTLI